MRSALLAAAVLCALCATGVAGAVVRPVASIDEFKNALASANPGDEIHVQYGVYQVLVSQDPKHWFTKSGTRENPIRIIGQLGPNGERPVFDADGQAIERGIFFMWPYNNHYVIENLEFRNARGRNIQANNAAAAYIQGENITFRNCYSHHNDNGWFATNTSKDILLENCETAYNGKLSWQTGDATHNHYMHCQSLTVRGCYIHDSAQAQNFKSRCRNVVFEYNWVENAASYEFDLASDNTDNTVMIGNVIIKRPGSGNRRIICLNDGTSSGTWGTLALIHNVIVSTEPGDEYVWAHGYGHTNVVLYNNVFVGPATQLFTGDGDGTRTGSHNWFQQGITPPAGVVRSLFGTDPGFVDFAGRDFHLRRDSLLRNAGRADPQWLNPAGVWEVRVPWAEYEPVASTVERPADCRLDIGAFEGTVLIGDVDGDGEVTVLDIVAAVTSFGTVPGDDYWNPEADFDCDGEITVLDIVSTVNNFGATAP